MIGSDVVAGVVHRCVTVPIQTGTRGTH